MIIPNEISYSSRGGEIPRREFLIHSAGAIGAIALSLSTFGCGGGGGGGPGAAGTFPVSVFSDIHFNPFYDTAIFAALNAAPAGEWLGIFQSSGMHAPSSWDSDTNYPLLSLALSSIALTLGTSPFIVYTGDLLGHNFASLYTTNNGGVQNDAAMMTFADKTVAFLIGQIRSAVGNLPVMFVLGNADSYSGALPEPGYLTNTAELYYEFLNGAADHQTFLGSFTQGGYYSAQPPGTNLMVIGLNTVPFAYPTTDTEVQAQLAWLDASLATAEALGKKVWLLMHIPPGAVLGETATTAGNVDANGHIKTATMFWLPGRYESFMATLASHPGLITMTLGAHTHMDEYRVLSPGNVLDITPAISPVFGNNPAFKVFSISGDTLTPTDYRVIHYDLAAMSGAFTSYYTFSAAYSLPGLLDVSLFELGPVLAANAAKQALYRGYYYAGNNASNPITNTNWPIYWSGIEQMVQQAFIDSVNFY